MLLWLVSGLHNVPPHLTSVTVEFLTGAVKMSEPEVQDAMATLVSSKLTISKDMYVVV